MAGVDVVDVDLVAASACFRATAARNGGGPPSLSKRLRSDSTLSIRLVSTSGARRVAADFGETSDACDADDEPRIALCLVLVVRDAAVSFAPKRGWYPLILHPRSGSSSSSTARRAAGDVCTCRRADEERSTFLRASSREPLRPVLRSGGAPARLLASMRSFDDAPSDFLGATPVPQIEPRRRLSIASPPTLSVLAARLACRSTNLFMYSSSSAPLSLPPPLVYPGSLPSRAATAALVLLVSFFPSKRIILLILRIVSSLSTSIIILLRSFHRLLLPELYLCLCLCLSF